MESSSSVSRLPSFENLRRGQRKVVDLFRTQEVVTAQLPTGYGKTRTAACSYLTLRARGVCNRMLYIVPRSAQAKQAADGLPDEIRSCADQLVRSYQVSDSPIPALKAHRAGTAEIFVVTIQSLVSSPAAIDSVASLMQTGRWFVVIDEHHHYGDDDNVWTQKVMTLPFVARLAMSATPFRKDGESIFGAPSVVVTYREAVNEGALKPLELHGYQYRVDALTVNGEVVSFTIGELFDEVGSTDPDKVDKFTATRQIRWSPKYVHPLVSIPLERLIQSRIGGSRFQMLVQAMSCLHAKMVCEQLRSLLPDGMSADWVGTGPNGRTDSENAAALNAFCPEKNAHGKRPWTLDVLVNVGMAGEGLDSTDVTEVVFLTSPNKNNTSLQVIGRGARLIRERPKQECIINVDSASELAADEFIGRRIMSIFDDGHEIEQAQEDADKEGKDRGLPLLSPEPDFTIHDVWLVEIKKDPMVRYALDNTSKPEGWTDEQFEREVISVCKQFLDRRNVKLNDTSVSNQWREACQNAVARVGSRKWAQEIANAQKAGISPPLAVRRNEIFKRINGRASMRFGKPAEATIDQLRERYAWLVELDRDIHEGRAPGWL